MNPLKRHGIMTLAPCEGLGPADDSRAPRCCTVILVSRPQADSESLENHTCEQMKSLFAHLSDSERRVVNAILSRALARRGLQQTMGQPPNWTSEAPEGADRQADPRVISALQYIGIELGNPNLRVASVARHVRLSKWHFARLFKTNTGAGFRETLRQQRLAKAVELLTTTPLEVKEVAAAVGYKYANQLTREFKRVFGTTPVAVHHGA